MSQSYEEIIRGERLLRNAPNDRHEAICLRLHELMAGCLRQMSATKLLAPRSIVELTAGTFVRPDLALVTSATGKLWLVAEIISSEDHHTDTVLKKMIYEELNLPRLWMVDPRYNNVEVYHGTTYGLALKTILAGREILTEGLLPEFQLSMANLFGASSSS
ncbi:MAG: Uma2 family endonuclease [Candidatus Omnitrophica bacterium]|nr:Uma2 family endonuclease [Candidatus Omnitrophota bacterium]